jgi:hypothetical protein
MIITSPGRTSRTNETDPTDNSAARLRRSVVSITSQVPAWQRASSANGGGMTGPSPWSSQ